MSDAALLAPRRAPSSPVAYAVEPAVSQPALTAVGAPAQISVVVPTYNERGNLLELTRRLDAALEGFAWELIVVDDDSPDGTAAHARDIYTQDTRVRCLRRIGRRGLSSACIEGMLASSAPLLAVMDGDLQHDPAVLRTMLLTLLREEADLVIGSRYVAGGSVGDWNSQRVMISRVATRLSTLVTHREISDPMSGFFALRREVLDSCVKDLSSLGFKILLDIVASSKPSVRITEVPFTFGERLTGESKLSTNVVWEYLLLLADKLVGRYVPVRFLAFAAIGALGVGVHFLVLSIAFKGVGLSFAVGQSAATLIAIAFNFSVNNLLTYSGQSLRGKRWLRGLASFYLICGIGALANIGISSYLFGNETSWPVAALAGIAMSSVWNYAVSARYTWKA
ncbi:MAG TPA: glycosyltransferase family 2 protein [Gemmatimonadaceae bacterium]|nr:glycosyltransferase family 2 protein [Gemmatimonadaceae bacterium]